MKNVWKMTWRTVRTFFGRYMAILLIVALSAGFFAGLKVTTDAMIYTGDDYLRQHYFYDYRLFSTIGFTDDEVNALSELSEIEKAEGTKTLDALVDYEGVSSPMKLYALTETVNLPSLVAGRMPTKENECLADAERFKERDIGKIFTVTDENDQSVLDGLTEREYTVVGIVDSPLHLGLDRGSTNIGSGTISNFLYLPAACFTSAYYTEISLTLLDTEYIYSDEYERQVEQYEQNVTDSAEQLVNARYDKLLKENHLTPELAEQFGFAAPEVFVLTRDENAGYVGFENDTGILSGVANIFPIFFIAIAILVCMTTMTRMIDEERTQIGTLKAMGFSGRRIMAKYLLYAGSATLFGWIFGFFLCTWGLPKIFWLAYNTMYGFAPIKYLFSPSHAIITLIISFVSILGTAYFACRKELRSVPAKLIRPRASKGGKRVLLERFTPLWKHLSFLRKITVRNMFRYKQRMFMMLVGIGCCAGLVVTGFGLKDSMMHIGTWQYSEIQTYDVEAGFDAEQKDALVEKLDEIDEIDRYLAVSLSTVDLSADETMNSIRILSYENAEDCKNFWRFSNDGATIDYPEQGKALINEKIAEKLGLSVGDSVTIRNADMKETTVKISGVFENYIYNYIVISAETYADAFGEWNANTVLIQSSEESVAEKLTELPEITSVSDLSVFEGNVTDALGCLNYILWLILAFAGALTFIVIFNLTNINIAERSREIATVQVLGFTPKETDRYVLQENLVLSVIASLLGLPLGILFHRIVMSMVKIDSFSFGLKIEPLSFLLSFVCSVLFAVIVSLLMRRQIAKINMAESLKAVE